jgi:drug/metabolite transporter (DMT)-like permease
MIRPPDRILPGVALMLVFCILAPVMDVFAKLAVATVPVGQVTAARFVLQGLVTLPLLWALGLSLRLSRRTAWLVALRAALLVVSTWTFVAAIRVMPVADALAIAFVEPFFLLLLGRFLFRDEVGPRRIAASVVGFCGALLVIQPSLAVFGPVAFYPLGTAVSFAAYMLVTRQLAGGMHPVALQVHTSLAGSAIMLPLLGLGAATGLAPLAPVWPDATASLWLAGVGVTAAASHLTITYALRFAPSATLAPLHYLEIVAAVALGYLVFGDFPGILSWAGIAVITGSGLYIVHRERVTAARRRSGPQAPRPDRRAAG